MCRKQPMIEHSTYLRVTSIAADDQSTLAYRPVLKNGVDRSLVFTKVRKCLAPLDSYT
jgi:hypothetical protein